MEIMATVLSPSDAERMEMAVDKYIAVLATALAHCGRGLLRFFRLAPMFLMN